MARMTIKKTTKANERLHLDRFVIRRCMRAGDSICVLCTVSEGSLDHHRRLECHSRDNDVSVSRSDIVDAPWPAALRNSLLSASFASDLYCVFAVVITIPGTCGFHGLPTSDLRPDRLACQSVKSPRLHDIIYHAMSCSKRPDPARQI